jgi:Ca2+-binding EF-hand superfamily protein
MNLNTGPEMKGNVMNTLSKLTLVAIVIFGMSSVATAADYTAEQLMSLMDTNGDGKITMDEAPEDLKTGFAFIDKNGDGGIDVKEAQVMVDFADNEQSQSPEMATAPTAEQLMALLDANRDGKITLAEAPDDLKAGFGFFDQNGDGGIDVTEAQVLADLAANEQSQARQEAPAAPRSQAAELYAAQALGSRAAAPPAAPVEWVGDLSPISESDWSYERARHLLERAGFGGTPKEIQRLAGMTPQQAVDYLVDYEELDNSFLAEFDASDIFYHGYPATENYFATAFKGLYKYGDMFGVKLLPPDSGPLHMQAAVTEAFYVYIADGYETKRLEEWWGERMVRTNRPLEEKLAYFWHGHFATSNAKALRYDLMKLHYETLRDKGLGNFKDLLIAVSQDPQMLIWLDNRTNTKRHPNENFAREVMELFTMGVGNYTEDDIRELARALTGWTLDEEGLKGRNETARREGLVEAAKFVDDPSIHDGGEKTFLGESGNFNGYDAIDIILKQDATAQFITWKLYRFFCNYEVPEEMNLELARRFRAGDYEIRPLLKTMFLSKDFYSPACVAKQIKSPVEQVVSTYRKLGLDTIPGIPNFGVTTTALGQELFFPPNVAGWEGGPSWINPATLLDRGNFARNLLFPEEIRGAGFDEAGYMIMNLANVQDRENTGYIPGESDDAFDRRMNAIIETARQARINKGGSLGATSLYQSPETTTSADPAAKQLMSMMDTSGDGKITMEELKPAFCVIDQNGDGGIDVKEAQIMFDVNNKGRSPATAATAPDPAAEQLMSFMDTNGDGKITMDEAPEDLKTGFAIVDQNGDGGIDVKEAQMMVDFNNNGQSPEPATAIAADPTAEQLMSFMDTNGDGKITMDEAPEDLKTGFAIVDQNGDGGIDVKEAQMMVDFGNSGQSPEPMAGGIDMSDRKNRFANPAETFHLEMGYGLATMKAKARVKPLQKIAADIQLVDMAREAGVSTVEEAVDHFAGRLLLIPLGDEAWVEMVAWMYDAVGSSRLDYDAPNAERVLRRLAHLIMSLPENQLG